MGSAAAHPSSRSWRRHWLQTYEWLKCSFAGARGAVAWRHLQTVGELCRLPSPAPPSRHRGLLLLLVMAAPVHRVTSTSFQPFCLKPWSSNILYSEDISSLCEESIIKADIPYIKLFQRTSYFESFESLSTEGNLIKVE